MRYVRVALYREELLRYLTVHGYVNRTVMDCEHRSFITQVYISGGGGINTSLHYYLLILFLRYNLDYCVYKPNIQSMYHHYPKTLLILSSSSSSSSLLSSLCRAFTIIYLKQTMLLGYIAMQQFCIYNSCY